MFLTLFLSRRYAAPQRISRKPKSRKIHDTTRKNTLRSPVRHLRQAVNVPGRYGDGYGGHGLSLLVTPRKSGGLSKTWAQAISPNGAKTSLGLGSYPVVTRVNGNVVSTVPNQAAANVRGGAFRTASGWRSRAPRPRHGGRERVLSVLSSNGRPGTRQGSRTPHRGAALPVDAYSLAVTCGSRGVSCDIWPASLSAPSTTRVVRLPGHDRERSPSRTTRRATTWFPPRQALCPAGAGSLPRLGGPHGRRWYASLRALPRMWRTVPCDASSTAYAAALQRGTGAAFTRRALRPGNVACGDRCVRGTIAPRHHAGTRNLVSKALGATGPKAASAPRHYRIPPPGDRPRKSTSAASGRRSGSDGPCALSRTRSSRQRNYAHGASHRPRPSQRSTVNTLWKGLMKLGGGWVSDPDIEEFFDTIPRDWLITFLEHRIGDRRVIDRDSAFFRAEPAFARSFHPSRRPLNERPFQIASAARNSST